MVDEPVIQTTTIQSAEDAAKAIAGYKDRAIEAKNATMQMNEASGLASVFLSKMGIATNSLTGSLGNATSMLGKFMNDLGEVGTVSKNQGLAIGALIGALDSAKQSFAGNWNFSNLNSFSDQVNAILPTVSTSLNGLRSLAKSMGIDVPGMALLGAEGLKKLIVNTANSADNAIRLRDVYVGLAARTGTLDEVNKKAGPGFQNMNALVAIQRENLTNTMQATHLSAHAIEEFYTKLGTVPGALNANTASLKGMTGGTNLLTSTIQIAKGTGMEYSDVVEGMRKAIVGYGASIPEALVFTTRISEISKKFKIELSDVKQEILNTSEAFKMFGKDTSSAAQIMNQYVGGLQQTGLSGQASANIVGNMTRQIGQLSIAQKAFISAQSGGPGGLQGAFGIDMMLRQEGGQKKVMDMVMKTMQRQMGPLVSTAEAAQGGPAAAQFTKQIMMLQQGPLGSLAKTLPEAEHLVDALKLMSEGKAAPTELKTDQQVVQESMKEGNQYHKQTATGISQMVAMMEQARGMASGASLSLLQSGFTAGTGEQFGDMDAVANTRGAIQGSMNQAGRRDPLMDLAVQGQFLKDRKGQEGFQNIQDWEKFTKQIPDMLKAPLDGIRGLIKEGKLGEAEVKKEDMLKSIERQKADLANAPPAARAAQTAELEKNAALAQAAVNNMKNAATSPTAPEPEKPAPKVVFNPNADLSDLGIPGENVRNAAARTAARTQAAPATAPNANFAALAPGAPENLGTINVDVTTYCSECHEKLAGQRHSHSVNVGQKKRK
jgi:hypothetical protein